MDRRLFWVTDSGNVDALYALIHKDPYILQNIDVLPFVHTPLHEASSTGKTDLAMELMVLKPSFAKKLNADGFSPLHLAIENHQVQLALELVKFDPDLVRLAGRKANPNILQTFDVVPFIHTPLHEASSTGKIDLAMKVMILKPSFAKKLNEYGLSPLYLGVENHQVELALELVKFDPSLVRIGGRGGMTPLHLVAKKGDVELLTEFLHACPESIKDANVNGETALHITVMNDRYEELKVLTGWMQRMRKSNDALTETHVLNSRDRQGNPALHQASYKNNHKVVKQLLKCMSLYRNIQNKSGMTALDVLQANGAHMNIDTEKLLQKAGGKSKDFLSEVETKSVYLRKQVTFWECCSTRMERYRNRMSDGARNALLVITALIITATYQTAVNQEEEKHKINAEKTISKIVLLWGFNTIAFFLSIALTFILIPPGTAYTWWYIFITLPLVCFYALSVYMKYDLMGTPLPTSFINLYMLVLFGFLVYLLVFYVRWKRNRQKKVPKPKDELIYKTMV